MQGNHFVKHAETVVYVTGWWYYARFGFWCRGDCDLCLERKMASMAMMGWWSDECFECFHDVRSLVCANQNRIFPVLGWNVRLGSNLAAVTAPGPSKPAEKL